MKISLHEALIELEDSENPFKQMMQNGSMTVEIYKPAKVDLQQPHTQDELYVIISGTGEFYNNGDVFNFKPLDVLFVPAGIEHRFENFTDDFTTWVIFYGKQGGELK